MDYFDRAWAGTGAVFLSLLAVHIIAATSARVSGMLTPDPK